MDTRRVLLGTVLGAVLVTGCGSQATSGATAAPTPTADPAALVQAIKTHQSWFTLQPDSVVLLTGHQLCRYTAMEGSSAAIGDEMQVLTDDPVLRVDVALAEAYAVQYLCPDQQLPQ